MQYRNSTITPTTVVSALVHSETQPCLCRAYHIALLADQRIRLFVDEKLFALVVGRALVMSW